MGCRVFFAQGNTDRMLVTGILNGVFGRHFFAADMQSSAPIERSKSRMKY